MHSTAVLDFVDNVLQEEKWEKKMYTNRCFMLDKIAQRVK